MLYDFLNDKLDCQQFCRLYCLPYWQRRCLWGFTLTYHHKKMTGTPALHLVPVTFLLIILLKAIIEFSIPGMAFFFVLLFIFKIEGIDKLSVTNLIV